MPVSGGGILKLGNWEIGKSHIVHTGFMNFYTPKHQVRFPNFPIQNSKIQKGFVRIKIGASLVPLIISP